MSTLTAILIACLLLLANAFFVAAEFALISARRSQIEPRAQAGSTMARTTLRAMENVTLVMAGAQLGITICSLGLGAVGEPAVAHLLGPPMMGIVTVLRPLIRGLNAVANGTLRLLRVEPIDEVSSTYTREEVAALVEESRGEGLLEADEYDRLAGALGFTEKTVATVLMPSETLTTVRRGSSAADVEALCAATGFSRFPVENDEGELLGYLHIKDVLEPDETRRELAIDDKWIRPFAPVTTEDSLHDTLETLQRRGAHMARVVDLEGTTLGLATLEDVIEELVGEIRDAAHLEESV
jgi:CBS domain containing-hemolysin-like protein